LGGDGYASAVFWVTCARFLSGREHGGNVGGVGVGWDVSEGVGRVWKYAIFIAITYQQTRYQYKVSKSKSNWFGDSHSAVNTVEPLECLEHAVIHGMWGPEYELEDENN
jgi:hypothetical protein